MVIVLIGCMQDQIVQPDQQNTEFQAIIDAISSDRESVGSPNVSYLLFQDGEILFSQGFGETNSGELIDEDTRFRIGSVTKSMTAASIFALGVPLNTPVQELVPSIDLLKSPNEIATITTQQLLEHSAGLVDQVSSSEDQSLSSFMEDTFFSQMFVIAPPGEVWNYSNLNYIVAGFVAEEFAGAEYSDVISANLFSPLDMTRTAFDASIVLADGNWARGASGDDVIIPTSYDSPASWPAGYAWSTAKDLASFGQFVLDGNLDVMSEETHQDFASSRISTGVMEEYLTYGNGLMHYDGISSNAGWHTIDLIYHNGSIPGYGAAMYLIPEKNAGFVSLVGRSGVELPSAVLASLEYFGLPPAEDFPADALPEVDFSKYEGVYQDNWNVGEVRITATASGLEVEMPRLDEMNVLYDERWRPYTRHNFTTRIDGYDLLVRFEEDDAGRIQYIVHRAFVAQRTQ